MSYSIALNESFNDKIVVENQIGELYYIRRTLRVYSKIILK